MNYYCSFVVCLLTCCARVCLNCCCFAASTALPCSAADEGEIKCSQCVRVIGSWSWLAPSSSTTRASSTMTMLPPYIRVHRQAVHHEDSVMDSTPICTPRDDGSSSSSSSNQRSSSIGEYQEK